MGAEKCLILVSSCWFGPTRWFEMVEMCSFSSNPPWCLGDSKHIMYIYKSGGWKPRDARVEVSPKDIIGQAIWARHSSMGTGLFFR